MFNSVVTFLFLSVYLVCAQPSGAPTPTYFLNDGTRLDQWVWPTVAVAALQGGYTYTVGANLTTLGAGVNITFTVKSGCSTSYNSAGPTGNQGWSWDIQYAATSSELAATPAPGVTVFTGPTSFGSTRLQKVSFIFNNLDVCNCIFVNYISFTTTDPTGTYNAHYWNGGTDKRQFGGFGTCHACPGETWGYSCTPPTISESGSPCDSPGSCKCQNALTEGSGLAPSWAIPNWPGTLSKRTNWYLYWLNVNQNACTGTPNLGSYGQGPSGSVQAFPTLAVSYL
jgi:hypothetical protein